MIELSKDQIEQAAKAAYEGTRLMGKWEKLPADLMQIWRDAITDAAPYLQSPWEPPTEADADACRMDVLSNGCGDSGYEDGMVALTRFVARRNAALLPPPVNPRRERVLKVIENSKITRFEELADAIIAALDAEE